MQINYCDPDIGEYAVFHLTYGTTAADNRRALLTHLLHDLAEKLVEEVPDANGSIDFYCADAWYCLGSDGGPMESNQRDHPTDTFSTIIEETLCRLRATAEFRKRKQELADFTPGQTVLFVGVGYDPEDCKNRGEVTSTNDKFVFVMFPNLANLPGSVACSPRDLRRIEEDQNV
jgi:hypothetical protein